MRTSVLVLALCAAVAQAQRGYDAASQRYQEELLRAQMQQQQLRQQQQQQYARQQQQAALMQAQREALMNAQRQAGGGGGGYPGGNSRPPLSKKEQKALKKKQEQDAKTLKELRKNNEKLRNKAAAQRGRGRSSRRAVGTSRGGLGGFVTSWKGIFALGGFAYLFMFQRELLMGKLLKYPVWFVSWLLRTVWVMALKPVVRFVVLRGKGGGELPGGSY